MPIPSTRANVCDTVARTITFTRHLLVLVVAAFVKHWLNQGAEAELRCGRYSFLRVPDCQTNVKEPISSLHASRFSATATGAKCPISTFQASHKMLSAYIMQPPHATTPSHAQPAGSAVLSERSVWSCNPCKPRAQVHVGMRGAVCCS